MCGGLRDMQSSFPPLPLLDDMKPRIAAAADGLQLMITSCRHLHVPASPAGLAIVAALEAELVQSGSATSRNSAPSATTSSLSSSPPLPIPVSSSSSSSSADYEGINYEAYNTYKKPKNDHDTVKIHNRGAQKSTIFYTSSSPPYRELSYEYDFLGVCFYCHRPLGPGKDVYMYRGDRAFCSTECRYKNIVADEGLQCSIQINKQCVQASSPTNQPKFKPQVAIPILV